MWSTMSSKKGVVEKDVDKFVVKTKFAVESIVFSKSVEVFCRVVEPVVEHVLKMLSNMLSKTMS